MSQLITLHGRVFSPDGEVTIDPAEVDQINKETTALELGQLRTGPERIFVYVIHPEKNRDERCGNGHWGDAEYNYKITSTGGVVIAQGACVYVGPRAYVGWHRAYRRPVRATIFGFEYHGWYFESSGSYARLKRSNRSL